MKSKKIGLLLSIIISSLLFIVSCDDDSNKPNMDFQYPLEIGSNWQYDSIFTLDYDSLATYNGVNDTIIYHIGTVEITSNEVIFDTLEAYNFESILNENGTIFTGNEYYDNVNNTLICYGYINSYMLTPKTNHKYSSLRFKNKNFNNLSEIINWIETGNPSNEYTKEDSLIFDPVICLEYPLEEGNQWTYRTETYDGEPWRIDKKIIDSDEIEVSAGNFHCWVIQWFINPIGSGSNWDEDIQYYDYVAKEGLIKRVLEIMNIECINGYGIVIGAYNYKEERILNDYQ